MHIVYFSCIICRKCYNCVAKLDILEEFLYNTRCLKKVTKVTKRLHTLFRKGQNGYPFRRRAASLLLIAVDHEKAPHTLKEVPCYV